jgi:putative redox protein
MAMMTSTYTGGLRTQSVHVKSGSTIITDAPTDNKGRGEAFSPTDLVCAALSTCIITTMAILADREGIDLTGLTSEVVKIMDSNPRKIKEIQVILSHPNLLATDIQKEKLKRAGLTCPVKLSLSDTVIQTIEFNF